MGTAQSSSFCLDWGYLILTNITEIRNWAVWQMLVFTSPDFSRILLCHDYEGQVVRWEFLILLKKKKSLCSQSCKIWNHDPRVPPDSQCRRRGYSFSNSLLLLNSLWWVMRPSQYLLAVWVACNAWSCLSSSLGVHIFFASPQCTFYS